MANKMDKKDKMTNSKALAYVLENCNLPTDVKERISAIKEQTDKKNASKSKASKELAEKNAQYCDMIMEILSETPMTCTQIISAIPLFKDTPFTTSKVSNLMKILMERGDAKNIRYKGASCFVLATED